MTSVPQPERRCLAELLADLSLVTDLGRIRGLLDAIEPYTLDPVAVPGGPEDPGRGRFPADPEGG